MKGNKRLKYFTVIVFFSTVMSFSFLGCAYHAYLTDVNPEMPEVAIHDKLPLKAALYIPDSTRNYTQPTDVSHGCLSMHVIGNFGQIFAGTVEGTLKKAFKELTVVSQPSIGNNDILIEADMTEYIYKAGCVANPRSFGTVKGNIRASDRNGREIWRSGETSKTLKFSSSWQEFVPECMASLVGVWTQELISQPQIRQLRKRTP